MGQYWKVLLYTIIATKKLCKLFKNFFLENVYILASDRSVYAYDKSIHYNKLAKKNGTKCKRLFTYDTNVF